MATLAASTRFANFDHTRVYFLPTIANSNLTPTRPEITAGTNITGEISDISGFTVSGSTIDTPDLLSEFVSKIPGRTSSEDSSLSFYADVEGVDARALFPYRATGYIVFMDGGDVPGNKMDVFPVQVNANSKSRSVGEEAAKIMVGFAVTREPAFDLTVPAA